MNETLTPQPAAPPLAVTGLHVTGTLCRGPSELTYRILGGPVRMAPPGEPLRTDELWRTTCFELFIQPEGGEGYFEFNFAPSGQWAAYRFDGYRSGMADLPLDPPRIEVAGEGVRIAMDLSALPSAPWRVGITAVIEEGDGTKSFWALAHPGERG